MKQLNERRASWAIDQKKDPPGSSGSKKEHIGPSGDGPDIDHGPEERPNSARKLWESPSKTVVNNFEDMKVAEHSMPPPHDPDPETVFDDDPKPVFGNTVLIRASHQVTSDEKLQLRFENIVVVNHNL